MAISDRKQRERLLREQLILEHADDMLRWHGYLGLNLDQLAQRVEYSKATIYNHFSSKEDLVLAVTNMHTVTRAEYFSRALTFEGLSRERLFVIGLGDQVLAMLYPHWLPILQLARTQSIWEKTSEEQREAFLSQSARCFGVVREIIRQARTCGDLPENDVTDEQIMSALISMAKGSYLLSEGGAGLFPEDLGIKPMDHLSNNYHVYLDGVGWKPLRHEWDYQATAERIWESVFAEERQIIESA